VQLRLELAESPAPAVALWELVGEQQRQSAMTLLAALIAQTVAPEAVGDELAAVRDAGGGVTVCLSDDGVGEIATGSAGRSRRPRRCSRICAPARRACSLSSFWSSLRRAPDRPRSARRPTRPRSRGLIQTPPAGCATRCQRSWPMPATRRPRPTERSRIGGSPRTSRRNRTCVTPSTAKRHEHDARLRSVWVPRSIGSPMARARSQSSNATAPAAPDAAEPASSRRNCCSQRPRSISNG